MWGGTEQGWGGTEQGWGILTSVSLMTFSVRLLTIAGEFVYDFFQWITESLGIYLSYVTY